MNKPDLALSRRALVGMALAAPLAVSGFAKAQSGTFTPEQFGALGDGRSNDRQAFEAMSRAVEARGGGTIVLANKTYLIGSREGRAVPGRGNASSVISLRNLAGGVRIEGGGATLRASPGGFYGSFDPTSRRALRPKLPHTDPRTATAPYSFMIYIEASKGPVVIRDLTLDGNIDAMQLGGEWGDTGRQIAMSGIFLRRNSGSELLERIHTHHHGQDGLMIDGLAASGGVDRVIRSVRAMSNGRQGCSIIGGSGYVFDNCDFSKTGRASVSSAPGAGVDIEAEGGNVVSRLLFRDCRFVDNSGCGMVADSGPSRDVRFERCRFAGIAAPSAWPSKPGFVFADCQFEGAVVKPFASDAPSEATHFIRCSFRDFGSGLDRTYFGDGAGGPIVDAGGAFGGGRNVMFGQCTFDLQRSGVLPWTVGSIFEDCSMSQRSTQTAYPRGRYLGTNRITGPVDLYGSRIEGMLMVNGRRVTA